MKDRVPTHPGRVQLIPVPGSENLYDMNRADEPIEAGTPLNKATLLRDETAVALGLNPDSDPTVDDAFQAAAAKKSRPIEASVLAARWDSVTHQNTVSVTGLKATDNFYVGHSDTATAGQRQAWREGQIFVAGQANDSIVLQADEAIPAVDIPLVVIVLP